MLETQVRIQIKSLLYNLGGLAEISEYSQIANLHAQKGKYSDFLFMPL